MGLKTKYIYKSFLISLLMVWTPNLSSGSYNQDIPVVSKGKLKFYFDTCSFSGKGDSTYQEFYLMLHTDYLKMVDTDREVNLGFKVRTELFDENGNQISSNEWITDVTTIIDSMDLQYQVVFDKWIQFLLPGKYDLTIKISNADNSLSGTISTNIDVKEINGESLHTSEIEFVFRTDKLTENSIFAKSGLDVYPNVWRRYGALNPKLTFYYEVYEIDTTFNDPLLIDYTISDDDHSIVKKLDGIELKRTDTKRSIIHAIDVTNLSSSIYNLVISIRDPITNEEIDVSRRFEIVQPDRFSSHSTLSPEDIQLFDHLFKYIADDFEYQSYTNLNDTEKKYFIINYWKNKDPNPATSQNEYLFEIIEKYNYSNKNFSWGTEPGWKSDRGRVLIQYGMPANIDRHYSEPTTTPYEIWTYELERSYNFVFVDRRSNGKFILVHSEMEGEIKDPSWRSLIRQ